MNGQEPTGAEAQTAVDRMIRDVPRERLRLAAVDPGGEAEAVAPLPSIYELIARDEWPIEKEFAVPEDRGQAELSPLGDVEYVEDLIRPGRIVVVAAEEGTGKSFGISGELAIRVATTAGGSFAGTWPVLVSCPVLVLSEMHSDDDYHREEMILAALDLDRSALRQRYFRVPLMTAAGGPPALTVPEWRTWAVEWLQSRRALLLIVDTATGATQVDPWGQPIQRVYADLRRMLEAYPELAIILVLHLKKPTGRGGRRVSDVLGEWGRWCDVVLLLEADGATRTKLTTYKRVRRPRHIVATRRDGLLVDPVDLDEERGTKVSQEAVLAVISAHPGSTFAELAEKLDVSKATAARYVKDLGDRVTIAETTTPTPKGPRRASAVFLVDSKLPPHTASRTGEAVSEAVPTADPGGIPPQHLTSYIGEVVSPEAVSPVDVGLQSEALRIFADDLDEPGA
jgi:hypothetical protein